MVLRNQTQDQSPRKESVKALIGSTRYPPHGGISGGPVSTQLVAKALTAQGVKVRILSIAATASEEQQKDVTVVCTPPLNVYDNTTRGPTDKSVIKKLVWHALENFNPAAYRRVRQELAAYQPDVFITSNILGISVTSWLAAHSIGIPSAHFVYDYFLMCYRATSFKNNDNCAGQCLSCRCLSIGRKLSSQYVDTIVGETEFITRTHRQAGYFANARTYTVPAPLLGDISPAPRTKPPGLRVGFLGFLGVIKGVETLAEAARYTVNDPGIRYFIAGSGDDPAYIKKLQSLFPEGNTEFVGWVDPTEFYPTMDVIVVPSIWREPFGRVSVEGTAYGVPAVVARSGGLPENVQHGVDGFVFEPRDSRGLAEILRRLARDEQEYRRISAAAHDRAHRYALDPVGRQLRACLEETISRKHTSYRQD
jgi:glycosyltransferase involved in cell wall biosynthesis